MFTGSHHVGLIVDDYDRTVSFYRDTVNATVASETEIAGSVRAGFVSTPGLTLEILSRETRGSGLDPLFDTLLEHSTVHIAYTVADIDVAMAHLEESGFRFFDKTPQPGIGPYVRAFVHPADVPGIPIELVELD